METGPLVVPEAMSAGVPVIGSARGGIPAFIRDGVDGILVAPDDVDAWAEAMLGILGDPTLLPRLAAAIRPPETMSRVVDQMMELYARV
jgi:glycosyltransferase involved in cell wall biosynthesis